MEKTLLNAGIAFLGAGVVGGGLEAGGVKVPVIESVARQLAIAALGLVLIAVSIVMGRRPSPEATRRGSSDGSQGGGADLVKAAAAIAVVVPVLAAGAIGAARAVGEVLRPVLRPATLELSPNTGEVGTTVTAAGSGFGKEETVRISIHIDEVAAPVTDADGEFTTTFRIPRDAICVQGRCPVIAVGHSTKRSDTRDFRLAGDTPFPPTPRPSFVSPALTLQPSSGPPGTTVTVRGTGFGAGEGVRIRVHTAEVAEAVADARGAFSARFQMPAGAVCIQQRCRVTATGTNTAASDTREFEVTAK